MFFRGCKNVLQALADHSGIFSSTSVSALNSALLHMSKLSVLLTVSLKLFHTQVCWYLLCFNGLGS